MYDLVHAFTKLADRACKDEHAKDHQCHKLRQQDLNSDSLQKDPSNNHQDVSEGIQVGKALDEGWHVGEGTG